MEGQGYELRGVPTGSVPSRRETVATDTCPSGWGCSVAEQELVPAAARSLSQILLGESSHTPSRLWSSSQRPLTLHTDPTLMTFLV